MAKKTISVQMEPEQLVTLNEVMQATGIDNPQVHIRLAIRKYLSIEHEKISDFELKKIRSVKSNNHFA